MRRTVACVGSLDIAKPGRCENDRAFVAPWTTDGAANAAGVTPHGASYHTDGCLSSKRARAQRRRRAGSRLGALRPLRLPARPARRARARHATPHTPHPSCLPAHHPRRLLCVSGGCGRRSPPLYAERVRLTVRKGLSSRRRRYDGRSPRPAAAIPRRGGHVTPRSLPAQGRAGRWDEARSEPAAWHPGRARPGW